MAVEQHPTNSGNDSSIEQDYPFRAVLSDETVANLDMAHRHIEGLIDEYRLQINEDGWEITVVDPSNVGMFDITIPESVFEEYDVSKEMEVGVDVSGFNDILQDTDGNTDMTYGFDVSGDPDMSVGDTSVPLIDPDSIRREPDIPDLDLSTTAVIEDSELFNHFVSNTGEHVEISASSEGIALHCDTDVSNDVLLLPDGNGCLVERSTRKDGRNDVFHDRVKDLHGRTETDVTKYSQDYLKKAFSKLLVKHVRGVSYRLRMGTEFPIQLIRQDDSDVEIMFMLAPRIETE